ncbi:MAG: glycosyltransferase family 4 protein [Thermoplasmata archaeon]
MPSSGELVRIVQPVFRYLPALGGATRHVQLTVEGLAARGHSVTVVTQAEPGAPAEETIAGVRVLRIGMRHVAGFRVPKGYVRLLRSLDADVLHLNGNRIWCTDFYLPSARSFEWPQVIMPMGFYHYWMRRGLVRWLYYGQYLPRRLRAFDGYIALTDAERDHVAGWGYPRDRVRVVPVGIDLAEFARAPDGREATRAAWGLPTPRVAVYAGGLYDNKRVDRLIRAVAASRGAWGLVVLGPDVPGTPYDLAHCRALAAKLSAPVRFLGAVPRSTVIASLSAADAYLQGSAFEGFGIGLLEAMAAGRPFIAFDSGAARELSATGAGVVVESEEEMARELAAPPSRLEEMGGAGRVAVREYSQDHMVERTLELYRAVGRANPGPAPPPDGAARI